MKHLKQLLFGAVLLEGGILGFVGFLIAHTNLLQPGLGRSVFSGLSGADGAVVFLFVIMAITGLVVAVKSLDERA